MLETAVPRMCLTPKNLLVVLLLAAISAGCSGGDAGTVTATPPPGSVEAAPVKGGPRMPRGPEGVKALQDAAAAKKK
jgi:hypothetical protein